ncbi:MAG: hypothetical protein AABY40_04395 [Nanoarchaeota archaeon]
MNLIEESFQRLFPEKEFPYFTELEYNRRLANFNANIRLEPRKIKVNLNLQWKDIDPEIKIGLIQHLLLKILKKRGHTYNIELYNNFIKNIPILTPKTKSDPALEAAFDRVNQQFMSNSVEKTNLTWGTASFRKLASYNFHTDTITVSTIFADARQEILDYLMYHEMLHKHHKFKHNYGRSSFHSPAFKEDEQLYPHYQLMEKEIGTIIRRKKYGGIRKAGFWGIFG